MNEVKVSIIIPVYNGEIYLKRCLESIINQTLKEIEIIVVNDGSTDKSKDIILTYCNADNRIKFINKKKEGVSVARNKGIEMATGQYLFFCDCDDYIEIDGIEEMYNIAIEKDTDIVIFNSFIGKSKLNVVKFPKEKKIVEKKVLVNANTDFFLPYLWRNLYKNTELQNKIRFNNIRRGEDVHFNLDYYNYVNKCRVVELYEYLYKVESDNLPWKKYGENYYGLVEDEYSFVRSKLSRWNVLNETSLQFQAKHLIYGLFDHIRGLILDKKQSRKLILDFIHEVIEREYCQEALENYNSDFSLVSLFVYFLKKRKLTLALNIMYLQIVGAWTKESIRKISIRDYMKNRRYNKQLESI